MASDDAATLLRDQGIVLLRGAVAHGDLKKMKKAASRCFEAIAAGKPLPQRYRFSRSSHSVLLDALTDFGCDGRELLAPFATPGLEELFADVMGGGWTCNLEQSWVRKKFAAQQAPSLEYFPHSWHQDGALGVQFSSEPGPAIPMTRLVTCWIPLNPCGRDSPGLEFVRGRQPALLHFTELNDAALRQRFPAEKFWAPELEVGDGLVFMNSVLHRTYARQEMRHSRLSVEYRIFPI